MELLPPALDCLFSAGAKLHARKAPEPRTAFKSGVDMRL
jgi:hypothetical protein